MKLIRALTIVACLSPMLAAAQDVISDASPKFFSLRNSQVSVGASFEGAFPAMMKSTVNPSGLDIDYKNNRAANNSTYPYLAGGLILDIYSGASLTGILTGINYSVSTTAYRQENIATDYFSINRVEIPVYLKLRPGALLNKSHLWLMGGIVFSLPVSIKRQLVVDSFTDDTGTLTDTNVSQVSDLFMLSASLGYEASFKNSETRIAFYISGSYSLNNQFNSDYVAFAPISLNGPVINPGQVTPGNNLQVNDVKPVAAAPSASAVTVADAPPPSNLSFYPNYSSHEIRFTAGVKVLFKLAKTRKISSGFLN